MPLAILVVHGDAALQERRQAGRIERLGQIHREQCFRLVEQETAIAVGAGDHRVARLGGEGEGLVLDLLGAVEQLAERGMEAFSGPPEEFEKFLRDQLVVWEKLIADAGIEKQ